MARNVWGVMSGLFVLALGVMAVAGLLRPDEAPVEAPPVSASIPTSEISVDSPPSSNAPELPGVSSGISRVLEWNGDAGFADTEELAQLPPTVAAVLTHYGVPLRIAITGDDG